MITVGRLRELLSSIPSDAKLIAYEGEGIGLRIIHGDKSGWIETGGSDDAACEDTWHDLSQFQEESAQ